MLIKTALDQLVWGPVMLVVFVGEAAGLLRCLGARLPGTLPWGALPACLPAGESIRGLYALIHPALVRPSAFTFPAAPARPVPACSCAEDAGGAPRAHPVHLAADLLAYHGRQLLPVSLATAAADDGCCRPR